MLKRVKKWFSNETLWCVPGLRLTASQKIKLKDKSYSLFDVILQEMLLGKMELKKLRAGSSQMVVLMLLVRLVMTRERLTMMRMKKEMKNWVAATAMMEKRVIN